MKIFFVTPEAAPFSKVGGLGDVSYHLPMALSAKGYDVTVFVPKYSSNLEEINISPLEHWKTEIDLSLSKRTAEFFETKVPNGHKMILIGCRELFDRPGIYGTEFGDYDDNAERFIFFSRAALIAMNLSASSQHDVVINCHDWPTAIIPMHLQAAPEKYPSLKNAATVFTYHNLANQGIFLHYDFAMTGLDWGYFTPDSMEFHGKINLTKAGLIAADVISTVSRGYAIDSLHPDIGHGLEGVLKARSDRIFGILNGVDYQRWDPSKDKLIAANYDINNLEGKQICRANFSALFGLKDYSLPTVAVISDLIGDNGMDLIAKAIPDILSLPINLVFMVFGNNYFQPFLKELAASYPERIGLKISHDPVLTHHIFSGADIFMMTSKNDPCGLELLYALKYGTVPLASSSGSLDDIVIDVVKDPENGTGYIFNEYNTQALIDSLTIAINDFNQPLKWQKIMKLGMARNYSWDTSAEHYLEAYRTANLIASSKGR